MDIFSILSFICGLALFLFGMQVMGEGLEKRAGSKMRVTLEKLASNPLKGVLLGAGVTSVIQSSSATTVMVVGFVNSGVMQLRQAIGIIMGANIGTTVTAWLLSLTGLESSNILVQLFKPTSFSPILAIIGIVLYMFSKKERRRDVGKIMLGFTVLIFGMELMSSSVKPLADVPGFANLLTLFSNPLFGVLAGLIITAIIQSSSASVGILQALSVTGTLTFASAIPIIMGQNIGTCVTALISAIGASKNAKRAALVHLYFNIIGTLFFLALFYGLNALIGFSFLSFATDAAGIAIVHSVFNILCTALLLPFTKQLERLAYVSISDADEKVQPVFIDHRFLNTPSIAVQRCRQLTLDMATLCRDTFIKSISLIPHYDLKLCENVADSEELIDLYEDKIGSFLMELSGKNISEGDTHTISELLHAIGDFERIGDHALNITEAAQELHDKDMHFSAEATAQLEVLIRAVTKILNMAIDSFTTDDSGLASHVEPLEEVVDYLRLQIKGDHIKRLQHGECTIELGFVLSDLLTNFERVSDHCSNIAVCVIQSKLSDMDTHKYLTNIKSPANTEFTRLYNEYLKLYALPDDMQKNEAPMIKA
ncbi:MAG: Na/Pi cotransporter family protein [Clostridia bacterium]